MSSRARSPRRDRGADRGRRPGRARRADRPGCCARSWPTTARTAHVPALDPRVRGGRRRPSPPPRPDADVGGRRGPAAARGPGGWRPAEADGRASRSARGVRVRGRRSDAAWPRSPWRRHPAAVPWRLVARPPRARSSQAAFVAFASQPGTRVVTFQAARGQRLAVAIHPGGREAWVVGTDLPSPEDGQVYELWFRTGPDAAMEPGGASRRTARCSSRPGSVGSSVDLLAVTSSPPGGSQAPTTSRSSLPPSERARPDSRSAHGRGRPRSPRRPPQRTPGGRRSGRSSRSAALRSGWSPGTPSRTGP